MSSTLFTRSLALAGWRRWLPMFALAFAALGAQAQNEGGDPPGRVAAVTERQGSVVFAAAGEEEWTALPQNRPLTQADRLWTDQGSKVELHLGAETVHVRDRTNLGIVELDDNNAHLSITQGSLNAHVRPLQEGQRFMVGTPNLSARSTQAADFRVDVDPDTASTRIAVHSGTVTVYGEDGKGRVIGPGEDVMFVARDLEQVEPGQRNADSFDQWAAARNQGEERSQTAQYVPHEVVGAVQLESQGVWQQDRTYGPVWYPNVASTDWAPYRQGRWEWIAPWGWTWIDDAPWGFAPFHYGRWAMIGSRWAWVPGSIGPRAVYSPALVAFVGGTGGMNFTVANSPGIAWYPLAPGEAWRPAFRASTYYVRNANRFIDVSRAPAFFVNSRYAGAVTSVRLADFTRGRPVAGNWHRVDPAQVAGAALITSPSRPAWTVGGPREWRGATPRLVQAPPAVNPLAPTPRFGRDWRSSTRASVATSTPTPVAPAVTPAAPVAPRVAPRPAWERDQARLISGGTAQGRVEQAAQDRFYRDQQVRQQQAARQQWQQQMQQQQVQQAQRQQRAEQQQQARQWQQWQQRQQQVQPVFVPQRQVVPHQQAQPVQQPAQQGYSRGGRGGWHGQDQAAQQQGSEGGGHGRGHWR